jgi:hypothetical protein
VAAGYRISGRRAAQNAITGAIVDRLTYKAVLVDMTGDSYRYRETLKTYGKGIPDGISPVPMQAAQAEATV